MRTAADTRQDLVAQQAALVAALTIDGAAPWRLSAPLVEAAARALRRKRLRAVAKAWPGLSRILGKQFGDHFAAYAAETPLPQHGGALADGRRFANWLDTIGNLPDECRPQVLAVDVRYRLTDVGLMPRRLPAFRFKLFRQTRRLMFALRLPWLGEYWASLRLP